MYLGVLGFVICKYCSRMFNGKQCPACGSTHLRGYHETTPEERRRWEDKQHYAKEERGVMRERVGWSKTLEAEVQILSDGKTCWVNASSGECIGRWSPVGVDIHRTIKEQRATGHQCLDCRPGGSWPDFIESMSHYYGVDVPPDLIDKKYTEENDHG